MDITILGSGDAFCSGGRANACMRIAADDAVLALEFGATALLSWKQAGWSTNDLDAVVISHLHGDHFGGLPFLMLDCQFVANRRKPLHIVGPTGLRARLEKAMEVFFPGSSAIRWNFSWDITEITSESSVDCVGFQITCLEVQHPSGAPALGLRLARGGKVLGFSGDTSWTPNLIKIADGADLFVCECFSDGEPVVNHMSWDSIRDNFSRLRAKKVVLTHMSDSAFSRRAQMQAFGVEVAQDGSRFSL